MWLTHNSWTGGFTTHATREAANVAANAHNADPNRLGTLTVRRLTQ